MGTSIGTTFVLVPLLIWKQLSTLETLLMLAPQISSTITDLEVVMTVRLDSSTIFTHDTTTNAPSLPELIPLRNQVVEMLHKIAKANIKIVPFTISIASESTLLPVRTTLFLCGYVPASYNTPEASDTLPERMHVEEETARTTSLWGPLETRGVLGGDDLRYVVIMWGLRMPMRKW
jgi:hypothetical protein